MNRKWLTSLLCAVPLCAAQRPAREADRPPQWIASWATAMQAPEQTNDQYGPGKELLADITVRQVIHLSAVGESVRIHVSNAFGK